jgi:hypothetical protein
MNFLDYLVNAMTGGQPSAQELEMRKMAQQGAKEQAVQSLLGTGNASIPSQGGLLATNYPNPYGLRSFVKSDGTYGGEMMPKTTGWQGLIPSLNGGYITEYSLGGNTPKEPFYPMVTQDMTPQMIKNTQLLEAGLLSQNSPEARALKENAYKQYLKLNKQGKSAFKDYN